MTIGDEACEFVDLTTKEGIERTRILQATRNAAYFAGSTSAQGKTDTNEKSPDSSCRFTYDKKDAHSLRLAQDAKKECLANNGVQGDAYRSWQSYGKELASEEEKEKDARMWKQISEDSKVLFLRGESKCYQDEKGQSHCKR